MAAKLLISPKVVEWNLSKVYRKLDIRSRAELPRRLKRAGPSFIPADWPISSAAKNVHDRGHQP